QVDRGHPLDRPALRVLAKQLVDPLAVCRDALDERDRIVADRVDVGGADPPGQQRQRVRGALRGLVEKLHGAPAQSAAAQRAAALGGTGGTQLDTLPRYRPSRVSTLT